MKPKNRLALITSVAAPKVSDRAPASVSTSTKFGPFDVGAQVRISTLLGDCWAVASGDGYTLVAREAGDPIVAGDRVDYEIESEDATYIYVIMDSDATEAYATVRQIAMLKEGC